MLPRGHSWVIEFMCSWCCCTRWRQIYCMYMYIVFVGSRSTTWQCTRSHSLPWIVLWCHTTLLSPTTSLHKYCRVNLRALFIAGSHDGLESAWVDLRSTWKAPVPLPLNIFDWCHSGTKVQSVAERRCSVLGIFAHSPLDKYVAQSRYFDRRPTSN